MKMAMLCDVEGWCFERTGTGLVNYHDSGHEWHIEYARPRSGKMLRRRDLKDYDVLRVGGVPLMRWFWDQNLLGHRRRVVPTVASFRDLDDRRTKWLQRPEVFKLLLGIIINDQRQIYEAVRLGVPIIYSPDRVCHETFKPMPQLRPSPTQGKIRVGWAGSEESWQGIKNVKSIQLACEAMGMRFVRQDRESDGLKSAERMACWFNALDLYVSANVIESCTPVTTLEAVACGVPVVTTRCGELWPLIKAFWGPEFIIDGTTMPAVQRALQAAKRVGRKDLAKRGLEFRDRFAEDFITWQCGEANRVTRALATLKRAAERREKQCG